MYCSKNQVSNHAQGAAWVAACMANYGLKGSDLLGKPYEADSQPSGAVIY